MIVKVKNSQFFELKVNEIYDFDGHNFYKNGIHVYDNEREHLYYKRLNEVLNNE